jgi:6-phosphofructokinase 2
MNELCELAEKDLTEEKDQEQIARNLISEGRAEIFVVSLGAAGVLFVSEKMSKRVRAPSVHIRSRVGAGDSMVAGITLALSQGKSVTEAVNYGIAAGSAAVMTPGTQLCRREDVERLYSQFEEF